MATSVASSSEIVTLADFLERLGDIPPARIYWSPRPGTATKQDVIEMDCHHDRLCELVDGVLVERARGFRESVLAGTFITILLEFTRPRNLGLVTCASGTMELLPNLVRMPDVAFTSWARIPGGRIPKEPIPRLTPDLAVEILKPSNTAKEMARKRREYFEAGVILVWEVDPQARTVRVYMAAEQSTVLSEAETLKGEPVLPGFVLPLRELFAELDM